MSHTPVRSSVAIVIAAVALILCATAAANAGTPHRGARGPSPARAHVVSGTSASPGSTLAWGQGYDGQLGNGGEPTSVPNPGPVSLTSGTTLTQVSAGASASEGLTSTGQVLAWGANGSGQLGDGNSNEADSPVGVQLPSGVTATQVAMGGSFGLALSSAGTVYAWGDNSSGELGNGSSSSSSDVPVRVSFPAGTTVTQIAAGDAFALALASSGAVYAWGDDSFGELGDGNEGGDSTTPEQVLVPTGFTVTQLAAGTYFGLALTSNGGVLAWGYGGNGELGDNETNNLSTPVLARIPSGTTVTQVAGGGGMALALTAAGSVLAWGSGGQGQLGDGSTAQANTPVAVSLPAGTTATQVAAGGGFGVAATAAGGAYAWGDNSYGELGDGSTGGQSDVPVAVSLASGTGVGAVAAGEYHALAIELSPSTVSGVSPALAPFYGGTRVTISGVGFSGATAVHFGTTPAASFTVNSSSSITAVAPAGSGAEDVTVTTPGGTSAASAAAGFEYVTAGSDASFGQNGGELCNGQTADTSLPVPAVLPAGTTVQSVAPGMILTTAGTVYTCGDNTTGTLGDGTTGGSSATPVPVSLPSGTTVTAIAANGLGTDLALTSRGTVYAWGTGGDGELGNGAASNSAVPVAVSLPAKVVAKAIAVGGQAAMVVSSSGAVYAWGSDDDNQLGQSVSGGQSDTPLLVPLPAGTVATAVAGEYDGALALTSTGNVYGWGYNANGELGNGSTSGAQSPVLVSLPAGTKATAIAAEAHDGLALTSTGGVEAWGYGPDGGLGNGSGASSDVPVAVSLPAGTTATSLGSEYDGGIVATAGGQALAWGDESSGSLGAGVSGGNPAPLAVSLPPGVIATAAGQGLGNLGTLVVTAPPVVTAVSPAIGPPGGGTSVTITGQQLATATGVLFGATKATRFTVTSPTSITAVAPAGTGTQYVRVTGLGGTSPQLPGVTFAYVSSGAAITWGYGSPGTLGNGTETNSSTPVAASLARGTIVRSVAEELDTSLAATSTGQAYAWGNGSSGGLGDGSTNSVDTPVPVSLPAGTRTTAVAGERYAGLALTSTGAVYAFGDNSYGALGNGSTTASTVPVKVALPSGTKATAIAGMSQTGLALTSTGAVYAWGFGLDGELGNGATSSSDTPVKVAFPAKTVVTAIAAEQSSGLALTSSGAVYAWGYGGFGELGNGALSSSDVPVQVSLPSGTSVTALGGASNTGYALTAGGQVYSWGRNPFGQLGNGTTTDSDAPGLVSIPAGTTIVALGTSQNTALALTSDGQVLTWGYGSDGELGDGTTTEAQLTPQPASIPHGVSVAQLSQGPGLTPLAIVGPPSSAASPAIYATDAADNAVTSYAQGASGNASPMTTLAGPATGLSGPAGVNVSSAGDVLVANATGNSVTEYAPGATQDTPPIATLSGPDTQLSSPEGLGENAQGDVFVADGGSNAVTEYAPGATGDAAPVATLAGPATRLSSPRGLAIDAEGDLFVADAATNSVVEFSPGATGNAAPSAVLSGTATGLAQPFGLVFDSAGALRVSNTASNSVTAYTASPSGNLPPSATLTAGLSGPQGMDVNGSGEIAVADNSSNAISFYTGGALTATISGSATGLDAPAFVAFTPPPAVVAGRAVSVARHRATLTGAVIADGSITRWYFQYRRRGATHWRTTATERAGRGDAPVAVRAQTGRLLADTEYRYRLVATNPGGTTYGPTRLLVTTARRHRRPRAAHPNRRSR